jgi:uncharacterized alpha/beta hydrolase family protein
MKKIFISIVVLALLSVGLYFFFTGDRQNKIARLKIEQFEGNYIVVDSTYNGDRIYQVTNGKVTTDSSKGYYYFWADSPNGGKKLYTQTPTNRSSFQEKPKNID